MPGVCAGSKIRTPTEASVCGGLRNCLFVVSCILHSLWNGVFRERGQCIFPGNAFSHLHCGVFCGDFLSVPGHHPDGADVSEPKQSSDLSPDCVPDGGNHCSGRAAGFARYMAVRYAAGSTLLHLLHRNVESVGCSHRSAEPEQLSAPHSGNDPARRNAGCVRCGSFQTHQRPLRSFAGGCVPCGNCGLHKKSLCLLRLLLPDWRRRILRAAKRRAAGSSLRPGIPAVPGGTAADNRLLAHGLLWRRCAFGREHGEGQGAGGPPNVSLQKKELSPPLPPPKSAMRQNPAHAGDFTQFPIH